MPGMSSRERVQAVLQGEIPDRVPYVDVGIDFPFICKLLNLDLPAGRYFEAGEYESPPVEIQLKVNQVLHRDVLVYNMMPPIPAIKHAGKDNILFFVDGKVKSEKDLDLVQLPDPSRESYLLPARQFLDSAGDYATICATRIGISSSYLAMGLQSFLYSLYDNPGLIQELLRRYTDFALGVVEQAARLKFDILWTSDDIAFRSGPFISPAMFRHLILPHIRKVAERARDLGIAWVYHSDGDLSGILKDLMGLGIRGLNPIEPLCMDIRQLKKELGRQLVLIGNVDVSLLAEGTPDQVREVTFGLLQDMAPGGNYMLASGNSVTSYCKVECVRAMCDALVNKSHKA
jgi:uroporphyrinogen-III decarboxylase